MPGLERTFIEYDLSLLRGIAGVLGLLLTSGNARGAASELAEGMFDPDTLEAALSLIDDEPRQALSLLMTGNGRLPAAMFDRRFGEIRPLGNAAREREQPWNKPANAAEALYYRGLIGRAFLPGNDGAPVEYVYIPDELVFFFAEQVDLPPAPAAIDRRPATAPTAFVSASSAIVDDTTTLLAYFQREQPAALTSAHVRFVKGFMLKPESLDFVEDLLRVAELVTTAPYRAQPQNARPFLEQTRGLQLQQLIMAWRNAVEYDDLARTPGLIVEGGSRHDMVQVRQVLFEWLHELNDNNWWELDDFVQYVKEHAPDFQRPGGNYDTLYIRSVETQQYLTGFGSWDLVEGALLRYLVTGPLHWLGLVDLTRPEDKDYRFRVVEQVFGAVSAGRPLEISSEDMQISVRPEGLVWATRAVNRYERFQIARVADWVPRDERYLYRISARSLAAAVKRGVTIGQVLAFLRRAAPTLPEELVKAIERWGQAGDEVVVGQMPVLRVKDPATMVVLRQHPVVGPLLGEAMGPQAAVVQARNWETIQDELVKMGMLAAVDE